MLSFGEGTSSVLEKVRRESLAEHPDRNQTGQSESESESEDDQSDSDGYSKQPGSSSAKLPVMMPASMRKKKAATNKPKSRVTQEKSEAESESDESETKSRSEPPRKFKKTGKSNNARPRVRKNRSPKTESEDEQSEDNSDEPEEQPPSKKKKPLTESKSNEKGNGVAKKQSNSGKMPKQQIRSFFPKHRNIDKSTGVEYNVTYGGTTVKFTEFKLRTIKPKPKSYPNEEENGQNGSRDGDDAAKNGIEENKTVQNGPSTDHKNNGINQSNDVKTEIDENEKTEK